MWDKIFMWFFFFKIKKIIIFGDEVGKAHVDQLLMSCYCSDSSIDICCEMVSIFMPPV